MGTQQAHEQTMLKANDGTLVEVWCHRKAEFKWSEDAGCYINGTTHKLPETYCLGERMIHATFGKDSYGVIWVGSTDYDWHGYDFGYDLGKAIRWVRHCKYPDLGCQVWGFKEDTEEGY